MKHLSWGRLVAVTVMMIAPSACGGGGGGERPSVDAIVDSLDGADLVADLSTDEVRCFAQALRDGDLPSGTLSRLVSDSDVTQSDLDQLDRTASGAAAACGFRYIR